MKMKVVCWCSATAVVLVVSTGCVILSEWEENRNEVVYSFYRMLTHGVGITCVEQTSNLICHDLKTTDVFIDASPAILQTYRIEGRKIVNCRWTNRFHDLCDLDTDEEYNTAYDKHEVFIEKESNLREMFRQQPNRLTQRDTHPSPLKNGSIVTVTGIGWGPFLPLPETLTWSCWSARQWAGISSEAPVEIEAFCQAIAQVVSAPECVKHYRSYLRAVPLFTEADMEAEKKTPLVKLDVTRYHVKNAIQYPYTLFPIYGSPFFSSARTYKPGDKFKVQQEYEGEVYYFLIETFAKGKPTQNKE